MRYGMTFRWRALGLWALGLIVLSGCSGSYGSLRTSPQAMEAVVGSQLPRDYAYYYCGRANLPDVVVGIDKAWAFDDRLWFKIESMEGVYDKIDRLSDLEPLQDRKHFKEILGPDGNPVGLYFSYYNSTGIVVDAENKTITVFNPYKPESRMPAW